MPAVYGLCLRCGLWKPFYPKGGNQKHCIDCGREATRERVRERREYVDQVKLEAGCTDCGYREHSAALDFDHLPGYDKVQTVSALVTAGTLDEIKAEITKCEVVCANCHRVRTALRGWIKPGPYDGSATVTTGPVQLGLEGL